MASPRANTPPVPKNGTPGAVTGVNGSNCHLTSPTTMSAKNGNRMRTANAVELSATNLTPRTFMTVNTMMTAQAMR